jgi:alpha-tubulin suppressor-like RCC1 family protein
MRGSSCAIGAALALAACVPSPTLSTGRGGGPSATSSASSAGGFGGGGGASTVTTGGDPCDEVTCVKPPEAECVAASTKRTYAALGTCSAGQCSYAPTDTVCPASCAEGACVGTPIAVSVGIYHACAIVAGGGVECWGANDFGQIGNDSTVESHVPVPVTGLSSGVLTLSAGPSYACAASAGSVACWGSNAHYQLGNNAGLESHVPVVVAGLSPGVLALAAGENHACAITAGGGVVCWGHNNNHGQLGNDSTTDSFVPVAVKGLSSGVLALAAAADHTCAVTAVGGVVCWGDNSSGQLGDGSTKDRHLPVAVQGLSSGVVALAAAGGHTCARTALGAMQCWGDNGSGQLGDGTTLDSHVPVSVKGLPAGVSEVAAGGAHTCAVTTTGALLCWGSNGSGELGIDSTASKFLPSPVTGLSSGVMKVAAGSFRTCAITSAGVAKCWGDGLHGGLGNDSTASSLVPVDVKGF